MIVLTAMKIIFAFVFISPLETSSENVFCGQCSDVGALPMALNLRCAHPSAVISSIGFASYGTPLGECDALCKGNCAAANSFSVVKDACIGHNACTIHPNTATFGDPCFGTKKHLAVKVQCSDGTGAGNCVSAPSPSPPVPPVPPSAATITTAWDDHVQIVSTHASLQVVSHRYLARHSPIHNSSFELLKLLQPHHPRYVPWFPMPEYAFCEPSAPIGVGTPQCKSSWNCTLPDQMMADFWEAVDGDNSEPIPNFSTPPSWLYPSGQRPDLQALGDYYGRLLAWYTKGGTTDECGVFHDSGHHYNITLWEVFNEPIAEHGHSKESYTVEFDAIVQGIRRWADPEHRIKFVGMNLANIRPASQVQEWTEYFLNPQNHAEDCHDALDYIGYHSYPTNAGYTTDPTTLMHLFEYYDAFVAEVKSINEIVQRLSPSTKTMLDECGTTRLPVLYNPSSPVSGPLYWVSSGAGFTYLYLQVAALSGRNVPVVGMSQLMDDIQREPGVTMIDWTNGNGTARYWALKLLRDACGPGDTFVKTQIEPAGEVYAQGIITNAGRSRRVIMVNKRYKKVTVAIKGMTACHALTIDELSGEGPARTVMCSKTGSILLNPFASAVVYDDGEASTDLVLV